LVGWLDEMIRKKSCLNNARGGVVLKSQVRSDRNNNVEENRCLHGQNDGGIIAKGVGGGIFDKLLI
jgi:hypothetical protein